MTAAPRANVLRAYRELLSLLRGLPPAKRDGALAQAYAGKPICPARTLSMRPRATTTTTRGYLLPVRARGTAAAPRSGAGVS